MLPPPKKPPWGCIPFQRHACAVSPQPRGHTGDRPQPLSAKEGWDQGDTWQPSIAPPLPSSRRGFNLISAQKSISQLEGGNYSWGLNEAGEGEQSILGWGCCQPHARPRAVTVVSLAPSPVLFCIVCLSHSSLSFFFNERLKIRLAEVTGCVSHPPARCCSGPGWAGGSAWGQGGRGWDTGGTQTHPGCIRALVSPGGSGTSLVIATVSLWWGHHPGSPHCHRSLCPHGMATTPGHHVLIPGHPTATGHHVPMSQPPPWDTSPPQATLSPWHGHHPTPGHPVPMAQPPPQPTTSPGHVPTAWLQSWDGFNITLGQQHPTDRNNTPGDPDWRPQGALCPCPQLLCGVQRRPPSQLPGTSN